MFTLHERIHLFNLNIWHFTFTTSTPILTQEQGTIWTHAFLIFSSTPTDQSALQLFFLEENDHSIAFLPHHFLALFVIALHFVFEWNFTNHQHFKLIKSVASKTDKLSSAVDSDQDEIHFCYCWFTNIYNAIRLRVEHGHLMGNLDNWQPH